MTPNDPTQARRANDVQNETETPNRRCLESAGRRRSTFSFV